MAATASQQAGRPARRPGRRRGHRAPRRRALSARGLAGTARSPTLVIELKPAARVLAGIGGNLGRAIRRARQIARRAGDLVVLPASPVSDGASPAWLAAVAPAQYERLDVRAEATPTGRLDAGFAKAP